MKKRMLRLLVLTLAAALLLQLPAAAGFGSARSFTDVSSSHWAKTYIDKLSSLGIVDGYADGSFLPEKELTCGEFMKMLAVSSELYTENVRVTVHWAQPYWTMLSEANALDGVDIPCTAAALNRPITRYEMAVMLSNVTVNVFWEPRVNVNDPGGTIADYSAIPTAYKDAVEQVYGKGIITGYKSTAGIADGAFAGGNTLTRAQATAVLVRLLWGSERHMASFANEGERPTIPTVDPNYVPFATRVQNEGLVNAWGKPSASLCTQLFGSSGKTYFHSSADAAAYMQTITVNVWKMDSSGAKYASTASITVHKLVAYDVGCIFQQIFENAERFPVQSVGGARFTDSLRHAWGCAIDINPVQNAYCYYSNGVLVPMTGSFWSPGVSPYSITPNGSVVNAFKAYGWGWGGQGYSSGKYDYMHFSIMKSGG